MRDPNPFEQSEIANQWIASIEKPQNRSREKEIYPTLAKWVKEIHPATIVEIGAGQGICSQYVEPVKRYIGIEPSDTLRKRAEELHNASNRQFIKGDSYNTSLVAQTIDAVFSVGVWFHVEDLDSAHAEVARILKSGGELLIFTSNPATKSMWESWFDKPKIDGKRIEGKVYVPGGHMDTNILYIHSLEEITGSLKRNDFEIISTKEIGFGGGERTQPIWIVIRARKRFL